MEVGTKIPIHGQDEDDFDRGFVVRWDPAKNIFVGAGDPTVHQEQKIREILRKGLLTLVRRRAERGGVRVDEYQCLPVSGCQITYTLRDVQWVGADGAVFHRLICECQAARGTRVKKAMQCAHILALQRSGFGGELHVRLP